MIGATPRPIRDMPWDRAACNRCGIERRTRGPRVTSPLCRDCKGTLNRQEQKIWAA